MTGLPARVDVVVIGAGLAGLAAAAALTQAGLEVLLVEAGDDVGGRVRTDAVDGLLLDRGFQLLNPAYPELHRLERLGLLDLAALDLHPFGSGLVVANGGRRAVLTDPRRSPSHLRSTLTGPGSLRAKLALARWGLEVSRGTPQALLSAPDEPLSSALTRRGITGRLRTAVVEPFLAGVLADDGQESSRRFVDLLVRTFVRAAPALPAAGMAALPRQLAGVLPPQCLALNVRAVSVTGTSVATDAGIVSSSATVLATDPRTATRLGRLPTVAMRGLTTYYHLAERAPSMQPMLHLDGDRRGPLVNTAVVSQVAPSYSGGRGALVASTVLGVREEAAVERAVRAQLRLVYGVDPRPWELVATYAIADALPAMLPPLDVRQPVDLNDGLFVAGDHRDTASIQGALVSGRRAATAVLTRLGIPSPIAVPPAHPSEDLRAR